MSHLSGPFLHVQCDLYIPWYIATLCHHTMMGLANCLMAAGSKDIIEIAIVSHKILK